MKISTTLFLYVVVGCTWRGTLGTCVWDSDFGFSFNCNFKKSGLFRIRNLGGIKGYFGLGLSVGDELGFRESITNLESTKRRSVQASRGNFLSNGITSREGVQDPQRNRAIPPFKPLPPGMVRPMAQQPERQRLVVQQNSTALKMMPAPSLTTVQEEIYRQHQLRQLQEAKLRQQQRIQQEMLAMQVLKQQRLQQQEAMRHLQQQKMQQLAQQAALQAAKRVHVVYPVSSGTQAGAALPNIVAAIPPGTSMMSPEKYGQPAPMPVAAVVMSGNSLPPFLALPSSKISDRISNSPNLVEDSANEVSKDDFRQLPLPEDDPASDNDMALLSLQPVNNAEETKPIQEERIEKQDTMSSLPSLAPVHGMETSLKQLAEASNITLEALEAAIILRQQQLLQRQQAPTTTTTTTTTTTPAPVRTRAPSYSGATKVMNAPREYYPVGYDKNFDDNFASRVDLPDTSFYCGDQKHFPGLYGDEDLGCMVFHVCALTDDGLIMKSFLCPESTLFDQTILKCNWWFYVDCKSTRSLYDSNIPISKSYQLMKALAFFSAYKSHDNSTAPTTDTEQDS